MTKSTQPRTWVRVVNGLAALALAAFVLGIYWPTVRLFDLHRADLGYQSSWAEGSAKRITAVTPGGAADRAGLKVGDVLEFDPSRNDDWVLAGFRDMPEGFTGALQVRHLDGSRSSVTLAPARTTFLPTLNDRLALVARLAGLTLATLIGVLLVWARPCLMTWSLLLTATSVGLPAYLVTYVMAHLATTFEISPLLAVAWLLQGGVVFAVIFALSFPGQTMPYGPWRNFAIVTAAAAVACSLLALPAIAFGTNARDSLGAIWVLIVSCCTAVAVALLVRTYRRSGEQERARLRWTVLGMSAYLVACMLFVFAGARAVFVPDWRGGNPMTPVLWVGSVAQGVVWSLTIGYGVLRQRVIDVQFAISRTVVYGVVSTIVLVFLAVLHWLLGRMIEHSGFAFGVEGLAAVGLGLALHRASHGINTTVDRVLFRKHHAAEERLRQVTAALPYASTERSIAEALVNEPLRNLRLASAALFYRDSPEGPLRRVRSQGWGDSHASSLDPEGLLVRYLQAEHTALGLDEEQQWLPLGMPEGPAHPVLAIPIVSQQSLSAVVLYGAHLNSTLPDPDEVGLLEALAKAAAAAHQHVRIAMLMRQVATLSNENVAQQKMIDRFEAKLGALVQESGVGG